MHIKELKHKKICILGFGREGRAMTEALSGIDVDLTIADMNEKLIIPALPAGRNNEKCKTQFGRDYLNDIRRFDVVIRSPGIKPCPELEAVKDILTNSTQIFLDTVIEKGSTVIGVTGSKGKSTTASLIHDILKKAGRDSHLVGNIGDPSIAHLNEAKPNAIFVLEISSYQLMDLNTSPQIAVITSFFPEHLDYHGSIENYLEAKKNIARFQTGNGVIFYNEKYKEAKEIAGESKGEKISFSSDDSPVHISETRLIGSHNLANIAAAFKIACYSAVPRDNAIEAIRNFEGLPHRLQNLGEHGGIIWIDDSISTTPETAIAAIDALGDDVTTIILGGQDRGNDFTELGIRISSSRISNVILMGESGSRIMEAIHLANANVEFFEANNMEKAVETVKQATSYKQRTTNKPICLLSPASPSYDMYKNFEERGDEFKNIIISSRCRF